MSHTRSAGTLPTASARRATIATTLLLAIVALAAALAPSAFALPPGGPVETRGAATLKIDTTFVKPPVAGNASTGVVSFTGTGFGAREVLVVKVDDGAIKPATAPPVPAGGDPNTDDGFGWVTADANGSFSGSIDLGTRRDADQAKLTPGKHHIRLIGGSPARSIHADFVLHASGPSQSVLTPDVAVAPPADQPVSWDGGGAYVDIPKLLPGSRIPYRIKGFGPNQVVGVKPDDQNLPGTTFPAGSWATIRTDANGEASGTLLLPDTLGTPKAGQPTSPHGPGGHWLRFLAGTIDNGSGSTGPSRSVVAPYAVDAAAAARTVDAAGAGQRGRSVALTGSGLQKEAFYLPFDAVPAGNTGYGQTVTARIDGTGTPFSVRANNDGSLAAELPIPADTTLGTHTAVIYVGFRAGSDFPQAVFERTFEVTELVPDPEPTPVAPIGGGTPPVTTPAPSPMPITAPTPVPERTAKVSSSALKAAKNRIGLKLGRGSVARKVTVTVRTKAKVRVGQRTKLVTVAKLASTTLKAGTAKQTTTVRLKLTAEGRALLKRVAKVRVVVRVVPQGGKVVTRTVWLRG